ncbi:alkaline phosphatase family protein [Levilactobacillus suantsaiihabitans]|uniref:Alkaline phosphatase family protein n=1 Tax=Levilactobacillus suantsaiihabitans TaxID=2487722 RepID=A0A4Z0JB08_9LACO|nr:ectonucleotide pyrophosphatase/phosphodiesterase [Levilactobacillus suantsaiihabitans]TGD19006.1 alkaline phosphatase family protein [Levilactobacillus suantsaiihabitans]
MQHRLVIISLDALGSRDLDEHLDELPNLRRLVTTGTRVRRVRGIYPTLTYPSHTTIITGQYPREHGIINNTKLQSQRPSPDWYWYQRDVKVPTLYDLVRQRHRKTAAFLWPVTAGSKITYNLAEIFPNRIWTNQVLVSLKASSPAFLLRMNQKYGHLRRGIQQPELDDFITACAVDTLKTRQPWLTLIHLVDMDSMRHRYGVRSEEAMAALKRLDARVGQLIDATIAAGTFGETNFAILGDHYQINVDHMIHLNQAFAQKGWLTPTANGTVKPDWHVWAKSCDGCTYIYTRNFADTKTLRHLLAATEGVEQVIDGAAAAKRGADPHCQFMVEAQAGYYFTDETQRPAVVEAVDPASLGQPDRYHGVHGYDPDKPDYFTTLVLNGPAVVAGQTLDEARLIDEAPTFAKLLGVQFPEPLPGHVLTAALKGASHEID